MGEQIRLMKTLAFAALACLACGCCASGSRLAGDATVPRFMSSVVESSNCKLELNAEMGSANSAHRNECTVILTNIGKNPVEIPDLDIGSHMSVFLRLVNRQGQDAPVTALGADQFHNFAATFVQSRTLNPGESLVWKVELMKSFVVAPTETYVVHAIYACHNAALLPDIEIAGMQFNPLLESK